MFEQAWSAQSAKILAEKQTEKERQIQTQLNELHNMFSSFDRTLIILEIATGILKIFKFLDSYCRIII